MLYGVTLDVSPTSKDAEEILSITFQKIFRQDLIEYDSPYFCATLVKLVIKQHTNNWVLIF